MARAKRQSDNVYNARRRYRRQAERYLAKAENASGIKKSRYEAQARNATIKAAQLYTKGQKPQGPVKALMERQGIDSGTIAAVSTARGYKSGGIGRSVECLVDQSLNALVGSKPETRDQMAHDILSTGNVGSRFYGGLVQVWGKTEESRQHPNRAILEFFGAESIMDVLEELENHGIDLYTPDENADVYKSVQLKLQQYILQTRQVRRNG